MNPPRIIVFAGSTRAGSVNARLAGYAARELSLLDCEVTLVSLQDYPLPVYNGDLEDSEGVPENAKKLAKLFDGHDGFFIVSPEYNGSLPPLLKNTIDWVSRLNSIDGKDISPYRGKVAVIAAASPGAMGGMSVMYHLRDILVRLGVLVLSDQVALGQAHNSFDEMDRITNERSAGFLVNACKNLVEVIASKR